MEKKFLAPITLVLLTFAGCIKKSPPALPSAALTPLRWATTTPPISSDWTECTTNECRRYSSLVMEGLFRPSTQEPGGVQTQLAAKVERTTDKEYRIELRRNVRWSDGHELLAHDFVDSWKKVLSRCRHNRSAKMLFPITGAEGFCQRKNSFEKVGMRTVGTHTIELRLFRATPFFLRTLAHPVSWPRRLDTREPAPTLGAFIPPTSGRTFRRNPDYHSTPANIESIEFVSVKSAEEGIGLYREGSVDIVDDIPEELTERLRADPNLILQPTGERYFLVLDPNQKPLQSSITRRTLMDALQPQETLRLSQRPLLAAPSLNNELPEPRPAEKAQYPATDRPEIGRFALSWRASEQLDWLADALRAQWNKTLGIEVELQSQVRPASPSTRLVSWTENWYEPSLPPFFAYTAFGFPDPTSVLTQWTKVQQQWISQDALVRPLFQRARALLKSPRLKPLPAPPSGGWNYPAMEWG